MKSRSRDFFIFSHRILVTTEMREEGSPVSLAHTDSNGSLPDRKVYAAKEVKQRSLCSIRLGCRPKFGRHLIADSPFLIRHLAA